MKRLGKQCAQTVIKIPMNITVTCISRGDQICHKSVSTLSKIKSHGSHLFVAVTLIENMSSSYISCDMALKSDCFFCGQCKEVTV